MSQAVSDRFGLGVLGEHESYPRPSFEARRAARRAVRGLAGHTEWDRWQGMARRARRAQRRFWSGLFGTMTSSETGIVGLAREFATDSAMVREVGSDANWVALAEAVIASTPRRVVVRDRSRDGSVRLTA